MAFERWGSLSVADHVDTQSLVANVLLYDRLVIPVMEDRPDRDVRAYWDSQGWDPELQARRIKQLGKLAIRRPWNAERREAYRENRAKLLEAEQFDADHFDDYLMTRMVLAGEPVTEKPPGVQHVQVIAAYNSTEGAKRDFHIGEGHDQRSTLAFLLTRRLAVPDLPDSEKALRLAIKLSQDAAFRAKRADLFDWQEATLSKGVPPEAVAERIAEMSDAYNEQVKATFAKVRMRFAFMVCGVGLGFVTGGVAAGAAGAALSLIQFATLDRRPVIEAGSTRPAAMFHDVETRIGIKLY